MSDGTRARGRGRGCRWSAGLDRSKLNKGLYQSKITWPSFVGLPQGDLAKVEAPSKVQSSLQIQIYTGLADIGLWLDVSQGRGGVKVKRRGVRSQGCHGDLRSGPSWRRKGCLSVAWPRRCGQSWTKATS